MQERDVATTPRSSAGESAGNALSASELCEERVSGVHTRLIRESDTPSSRLNGAKRKRELENTLDPTAGKCIANALTDSEVGEEQAANEEWSATRHSIAAQFITNAICASGLECTRTGCVLGTAAALPGSVEARRLQSRLWRCYE